MEPQDPDQTAAMSSPLEGNALPTEPTPVVGAAATPPAPPPEPPTSGPPPGTGDGSVPPSEGRGRTAIIVLLVILVLLVGTGVILLVTRKDGEDVTASTTSSSSQATTTSSSSSSSTTRSTSTTSSSTTTSTSTSTTTTTAPAGPTINLQQPPAPDCSNPNDQTPYPTFTWTGQNATSVTVSIDGPGEYQTYPGASGSAQLPFSCPGPHTYTFTANGTNGTTAQKVTTLQKK